MGEKSNKSKESVHQPKSEKDLKYFAGLFTVQIRDGQTDQSIIDYLNTNKILEYHVNTLGRTTHHGNEYTYLGFFTEAAKNDFINDGRILGTIGKFRDLEWLNKLNKTIIISATGIDGENTDINEVIQAIEDKLGKLKNVTQKTGNGKWISMKLEMDIKCTEDELFNTWGVLVKNKMIKIEPMNYKHHITKQRGRIMAEILDIPNEIDETTFSKILNTTNARYWFKTNNRMKGTYNMKIYFNNDEDRKQAINKKIKIDGKIFTWFFRTGPGRQNNFRNERRNDNGFGKRFQQEMYDGRKTGRSRCNICKRNNHITDECYFNNRNRTHENRRNWNDNWNETYRYRKGRYDNEGKFRYDTQQQQFRNQKNIRIIGIYNPNNDKPTTNNIEKHLAKWMNEAINLEYETIILGDFNESANNKKKLKPLTNTIKNHGLQDIHESLTVAEDRLDTWKSGDNSSRIDFIFASEGFQEKQEDWKEIAEEVETRLETLDQNTTQHLNREMIWKTIVDIYDEEKNRQLIKIRKRKEDSKKDRDESLMKTNEERLEELITEYENLEKIDTIEHGISKITDKVIKKLWQDRKAFQYKYNFKEFEETIIIEQWGTTDTAPGSSGITYDFWKKSGNLTRNLLLNIFNDSMAKENVTDEWKKGFIYPINKTSRSNWNQDLNLTRPIVLLETARKIWFKILVNRLGEILTKEQILTNTNFAALKNESTLEPIKIIQAIIEDANNYKKEAWILLMDISKAYDSVNTTMLKRSLERIKLPPNFINIVMDVNLNRFNRVLVNNELTDEYHVEDGIDQGEIKRKTNHSGLEYSYYTKDRVSAGSHSPKEMGIHFRYKTYLRLTDGNDIIGIHLELDGDSYDLNNSPQLKKCQGCFRNISKKKGSNECLIYIENEICRNLDRRKEEDYIKPYETLNNIIKKNEWLRTYTKEDKKDESFNKKIELIDKIINTNDKNFLDIIKNSIFEEEDNLISITKRRFCLLINTNKKKWEINNKGKRVYRYNVVWKIFELNYEGKESEEVILLASYECNYENEFKIILRCIILGIMIISENSELILGINEKVNRLIIEFTNNFSNRKKIDSDYYLELLFLENFLETNNIELIEGNEKIQRIIKEKRKEMQEMLKNNKIVDKIKYNFELIDEARG
ncbi:hypothetical protein GLOIN_2v29323 [Rhizophagus irregularis DAOM 181602=DAOM 197198]|nr:hypothetical protein GLOIN_2v29323 [Rhizophagus irregularis DAOM 181602=DAOM 197198]